MTDKIAEINPLVIIAANKANQELGNISTPEDETGNRRRLLSTDAAIPIINKYEESELHRENSYRDPSTGLLNRRGLIEEYRVSMGVRERAGLVGGNALVALDLIGLKKLNVDLTPEGADEVIKNAAEHLQGHVRDSDFVGRWGGDEDLLVLFGIDKKNIETLIVDIKSDLPEHVRFNIGFVLIEPDCDIEESMHGIMNKMEEVKKIGGLDETGRASGNGVVVDINSLNQHV